MTIPQSVRDELDQTPRWWIGRYHDALAAVGAPHVEGETAEVYDWAGGAVLSWSEVGYLDCPCSRCRRICSCP